MTREERGREGQRSLWWVVLLGLSFGAYFTLRYQGYWAEIDSSVFVAAIERFREVGRLSYSGAYLHGYAYVVWVAALADFTGLPVTELVQVYLPILGTLLVALFAHAAFRRLLGSDRLGVLAASVLFLVPEFVFTVARGNHEKIDISMILLALLALVQSGRELNRGTRPGVFAAWVLTYHFAVFTLSSSNTFFGTTFALATTLLTVGLGLALRLRPAGAARHGRAARRLVLTVGASWCLVLLMMWYLYPAASSQLQSYKTMFARLASLFLSFDTQSNPYAALPQEWVSRLAYRVISAFRWVLFATSFAVWLVLLARALRRPARTPTPRLFLLGLYGAFGVLLAFSIPVDFLGLAEGSNWQVRLYTYFVLFAAPLFSLGLALALRVFRVRAAFSRARGWPGLALRAGLVAFALFSLLKATVDPVVSNLWTFYLPQEVRAMNFWAGQEEHAALWTGPRGRLNFAYATTYHTFSPRGNAFVDGPPDAGVEMALDSPVVRAQAAANGAGLPPLLLGNRVYDNGAVQLLRRVPQGPFER